MSNNRPATETAPQSGLLFRVKALGNSAVNRPWRGLRVPIALIAVLCVAVVGHDLWRTWEGRSKVIEQTQRQTENLTWSAFQHAEAAIRLANVVLVGLVEQVDPITCDQESVQAPGSIQPQGALVVARLDNFIITHVSQNPADFLGVPSGAALGRALHEVLGKAPCGRISSPTPAYCGEHCDVSSFA